MVRRLYFHPLSSFPGPRLAAATSLYKTYYDIIKGGEMLTQIHRLHSIYGSVIRIGPNELHFNDFRAYSEIYSVGSHLTKDPKFYSCFNANGSAFGAIDPHVSKTRRSFMNKFFSRKEVIKLEDVIQQKVDRLVSKLETTSGTTTDMFLAFRSATLDIITAYMFGHCLDAIEYPDFSSPLLLNIQIALPLLWVIKSFPWVLPILSILPKSKWCARSIFEQFQALLFVRNFLVASLDRTAQEVKLKAHPEPSLSTICHRLFDPMSKAGLIYPSLQAIIDESLSLLQAGSDTVGNTCTVGTFYVLNDKVIYTQLITELRTQWPDKTVPVDLAFLQKLPYLTAVIKESLRLSHGFVTPLPRIVGHSGAKVGGFEIPPNTIVSMSVTSVHLNETLFPNPSQFKPERWLHSSHLSLGRFLVPFSAGPRMCMGMSMAWAELYLFFGYLFRKLDMQIIDTDISDFCTYKDYFVPIHVGRHLRILVAEGG
ncbi:Cytochrome P450 monooxygenase [Psilocybe cubensis]|uniref:Cytochrome P450 monooxygenase n=2 Tax=Psilocybe cubensis TaxID=181762 RepID=A0ACB8H4M6_PSICU|nr:Cytochrome P450 monooxygenase [Psilocybe cubensis]KAH9482841.1 Cytochrome P450 monooxygenase [Psilocybe cubensis]